MNATASQPTQVIFSRDGQRPAAFPDDPGAVTKIVIGTLPGNDEEKAKPAATSTDLEWLGGSDLGAQFPNLTHLYLWRVHGLVEIDHLPPGLKCLDIRHSADLKAIKSIPGDAIETLMLEDLAALQNLAAGRQCPRLRELIIKQCPALPKQSLNEWVSAGVALTHLDLSGTDGVTGIVKWPVNLLDFRCNDCVNLKTLPAQNGVKYWPQNLRRLEMRGTAVPDLGEFPAPLDYIDLGGMKQLKGLPKHRGSFARESAGLYPVQSGTVQGTVGEIRPRSLFLHGSGILMPPASEHGSTPDENVATPTLAYFKDVEQVGPGQVKRCKIMVLGNGGAGKTCLSLNLSGGDPTRTDPNYPGNESRIRSTHGIVFHPMKHPVDIDSNSEEVDVHIWDFGGQEIYHNTHRLFLSTGTIFILLWKPEQDGEISHDPNDKWRPLSYWLDYITMACRPHFPEIAIVGSGHSQSTPALLEKLREHIGDHHFENTRHFFIDSLEQSGDLGGLKDWISQRGGEVISRQGTCVPSYWEIAQEMVEGWVEQIEKDPEFAKTHQQMTMRSFGDKLVERINHVLEATPERFEKLYEAIDNRTWRPTEDHIARALGFLDNISWVYWKPKLGINKEETYLSESRAIIGQKWALEGIYTLLKRVDSNPDSVVYEKLKANQGIFTLADLDGWGWKNAYTPEEQKLLLSFLRDIGLCFHLNNREDSWWREEAKRYLSISHLEAAKLGDLKLDLKRLDKTGAPANDTITLTSFHMGHWYQLLTAFGEKFGTAGLYFKDAFFLKTDKGQGAIVSAEFDPDYLKGEIHIESRGPDLDEFQKKLVSTIREVMGDLTAGRKATVADVATAAGAGASEVEIFISYKRSLPGQPHFHKPAEDIHRGLEKIEGFDPLLDDKDIPDGALITDFMMRITGTSYAVVVYSDAYFMADYCMWEFCKLLKSYSMRANAGCDKNLILVRQEAECSIHDPVKRQELIAYWENKTEWKNIPGDIEDFRKRVILTIKDEIPKILHIRGIYQALNPNKPEDIVTWIESKIAKPGRRAEM